MIHLKHKVCFLGDSGVGKSSLISLLQGRNISKERKPTIGLEIESSQLNPFGKISIWDFGGQERFKFMWQDFLRGAGLAVLVTDSTEENVQKAKEIINRFSRHVGAKIIAIANKQDIPGSLNEAEVQKRLGGVKTYGMSAIRTELRQRMQDILDYELKTD